jgi:hypothetical protein
VSITGIAEYCPVKPGDDRWNKRAVVNGVALIPPAAHIISTTQPG